jgi:hypothetical protein
MSTWLITIFNKPKMENAVKAVKKLCENHNLSEERKNAITSGFKKNKSADVSEDGEWDLLLSDEETGLEFSIPYGGIQDSDKDPEHKERLERYIKDVKLLCKILEPKSAKGNLEAELNDEKIPVHYITYFNKEKAGEYSNLEKVPALSVENLKHGVFIVLYKLVGTFGSEKLKIMEEVNNFLEKNKK